MYCGHYSAAASGAHLRCLKGTTEHGASPSACSVAPFRQRKKKGQPVDIRTAILNEISIERDRQEQLRAEGRFAMTCASPDMSMGQRLAVLAEEYGEVAHEVNEGFGEGRKTDVYKLGKELIQCAAVAVAWLESYEMTREKIFSLVREQLERQPRFDGVDPTMRFLVLTYYFNEIRQSSTSLKRFVMCIVQWLEELDRS